MCISIRKYVKFGSLSIRENVNCKAIEIWICRSSAHEIHLLSSVFNTVVYGEPHIPMFPWLHILYLITILLPLLSLSSLLSLFPPLLPSLLSSTPILSLPLPSTLTVPFPSYPSPSSSPSPLPLPSLCCRVCQLVPADGKPLPSPPHHSPHSLLLSLHVTHVYIHPLPHTKWIDLMCSSFFASMNALSVSVCACIQAWHSCVSSRN